MKYLCIVAVLVSVMTIIIGVVGQETKTWKNVSIQTFKFKGIENHVIFIEDNEGEKWESKLLPEQKFALINTIKNKVADMKLAVSKQ